MLKKKTFLISLELHPELFSTHHYVSFYPFWFLTIQTWFTLNEFWSSTSFSSPISILFLYSAIIPRSIDPKRGTCSIERNEIKDRRENSSAETSREGSNEDNRRDSVFAKSAASLVEPFTTAPRGNGHHRIMSIHGAIETGRRKRMALARTRYIV